MAEYTDKQKKQIAYWSEVREKAVSGMIECDLKLSEAIKLNNDDISELFDERKILSAKYQLATDRIDEAMNARIEYLRLRHKLKDYEEKWGF